MRTCIKCKTPKDILEFHRSKNSSLGHVRQCKECTKREDAIRNAKKAIKFNGLYSVWGSMKKRCYCKNNIDFKYYGGRGIGVCEEWRDSFLSFYDWAKDKRKKGTELDRIKNDENYKPDNCRFVPKIVNNHNRDCIKLSYHDAEKIRALYAGGNLLKSKIARMFGVTQQNVDHVIKNKIWKIQKGAES